MGGYCSQGKEIYKYKRVNESNTKHAVNIPESSSEKLYNAIFRIQIINEDIKGTGFFIKFNIKKKSMFFLATCYHILSERFVNEKRDIEIFYGKKGEEKKLKITLNKSQRHIRYFDKPNDVTFVQILESDKISEDKFLNLDLNYKNGYNIYIDKSLYLAGYPQNKLNKNERCISSGEIKIINNKDSEFEHTLDTGYGSSGSPICLSDNLCVIGIHKEGDKFRPVNYGTFLGFFLDILEEEYEIELANKYINNGKDEEEKKEENEEDKEEDKDKRFKFGIIEKYTGEFKKSLRHGHGTGYYSNGNSYVGDWVNNKKHGQGKYTFYNGDIYIGEFKNDKIDGKGVFYFNHGNKRGDRFEGILHLGIPEFLNPNNLLSK